ncbi:MAG TPA: ORF6N domain-containing protein [Sulfurimonas sp.]|uniref:ORF6N domain-containing protein n=1 Tax=Sulfurimonas sp. TaxID=2022749 RepID=UPI002C61D4D3|nr:ORF6N domain-containing protein [Sulfurimonas sp.]HUH43480.1 ORF6N domain-containing protein [Sulfurimonas sp.]
MDLITNDNIETKIYTIRNIQFMLDSDLAKLYGVETKRINEAVKNNLEKFPDDFYFELAKKEDEYLRSNFSTFKTSLNSRKYAPKVFTEQGVYMLATILKSKIATDVSIAIIRAFAQMRKVIHNNVLLQIQLENLEKRQTNYEVKTDEKLELIFKAIESKQLKPTQGIFYDGQIYDAYSFILNLIRTTKKEIVLIDNYIDDTTLTLFSKVPNIQITIYTNVISKQLKLDFEKYSAQYDNVKLETFKNSHDRFLIIDNSDIFHIGASLKDLGKKWFAFSKIDISVTDILDKLV